MLEKTRRVTSCVGRGKVLVQVDGGAMSAVNELQELASV